MVLKIRAIRRYCVFGRCCGIWLLYGRVIGPRNRKDAANRDWPGYPFPEGKTCSVCAWKVGCYSRLSCPQSGFKARLRAWSFEPNIHLVRADRHLYRAMLGIMWCLPRFYTNLVRSCESQILSLMVVSYKRPLYVFINYPMLSLLQPHLWIQEVFFRIFIAGGLSVLVAGTLHLPKCTWAELARQRYSCLGLPFLVVNSPLEQFRDVKLASFLRIDLFGALFLGISRLRLFALTSGVLIVAFGSFSVNIIPSRSLSLWERRKARLFSLVRRQLKGKGLEMTPFFV